MALFVNINIKVSLTAINSRPTMHQVSTVNSSSVVRAFAHGVMGCRIDPSWGGPIELFLVPTSVPRLV